MTAMFPLLYCAKCGSRQPGATAPAVDPLSGITPRTASILCYIPGIGWIASVIVLAADKFRNDKTVRVPLACESFYV